MKETNFFSGPPEGIPYPPGSRRIARLCDYERLFDPAFEVRGEASPCYALYPRRKGVPERISELVPKAKLIYLVRDPIERAVSHYNFQIAVENERRSLRECLTADMDSRSLYMCAGRYGAQLERYLRYFPEEQIMVIDQHDLLTNRERTLSRIFAFLSVDDSFASPAFREEANTGRELRSYSYFAVLHRRVQASRSLQWLVLQRLSPSARRTIRQSLQRLFSDALPSFELDADTRDRLRELCAPDVEQLRRLTGEAFSTWSV